MGYLDGKTLNDLTPLEKPKAPKEKKVMTDEEKLQVVELLRQGKGFKQIKMKVRRVKMEGDKQIYSKAFSYSQFKEVENEWKAKIAELTPKPKEEEVKEVA